MILECPACHARFMVPDSAIPTAGRTVKCGKCTHQWHVAAPRAYAEPVSMESAAPSMAAESHEDNEAIMRKIADALSEPAPMKVRPIVPERNLPMIKRPQIDPRNFKIAVPLIAALWLITAFIAYFPSWIDAPGLSGIYKTFGMVPNDGLVFADVHMDREQEGNKTKFILSGSIRNDSNVTRTVPSVRVLLKNKENDTLWGREYPVKDKTGAAVILKGGEVYPFRITNVETSFASSVRNIVVDLGHSLQLMMR